MELGQSPQRHAGQGAGALTTVMRAAQLPLGANLPLVLRIGVVRAGRIVEERIIKQRKTVSIGASEDATFVAAAPRTDLFVLKKEGYVLRLHGPVNGRIALASEVVSLETLRARGLHEIALTDESRGKVVVGETTFLFQFVRPPPPQPRPQLPLAVKGGLASQIDWSLTIIAALSFLLHFGIVGAMYSDWMDETVDEQRAVAGLVDMVQRIPTVPVEAPVDPSTPAETPTEAAPKQTTSNACCSSPSRTSSANSGKSVPRSMSDAQAASLADRADQMQIGLFASVNSRSTSVQGALNRSDLPTVDLSARAASADGAVASTSDLHMHGGGPAVAGRNNGGIGAIANTTHGTSDTNAGPGRTIDAPKFDTQIGSLGGGTTVNGADRTIAGLRARFRACYQKGLNADPTMAGKVIISAKIGPNGEVISADVASSSGLSQEVSSCIASTIKRAQFDAQPGTSNLSVPVSFVKQ